MEMKNRIGPKDKHVWNVAMGMLSRFLQLSITTTSHHLDQYCCSSPSTKGLHAYSKTIMSTNLWKRIAHGNAPLKNNNWIADDRFHLLTIPVVVFTSFTTFLIAKSNSKKNTFSLTNKTMTKQLKVALFHWFAFVGFAYVKLTTDSLI